MTYTFTQALVGTLLPYTIAILIPMLPELMGWVDRRLPLWL